MEGEKGPPPCHLRSNGAYTVFVTPGKEPVQNGEYNPSAIGGMYFGLTTGSRCLLSAFEELLFWRTGSLGAAGTGEGGTDCSGFQSGKKREN